MVKLVASDGQTFEVDQDVVNLSNTISSFMEDSVDGGDVPLPNVSGEILARVIEYCRYHADANKRKAAHEAHASAAAADGAGASAETAALPVPPPPPTEDEIKKWDAEFVKLEGEKNADKILFDLILAANYLNIKSLLDILCQTVALQLKGKTPEEIRKRFGIVNDFTPEEEEEVRRENQWAFD